MRKLLVTLAVVAVLGALGATLALGATRTIRWGKPTTGTYSIGRGGTVRWVWRDSRSHNVHIMTRTGRTIKVTRVVRHRGHVYSRRFFRAATYRVICDVHPSTMRITLKVR